MLGNPHNGRYSVSFMWLPSVLKVKNLHKPNLQSRGQFTFLMVFMNATLLLCLNPRWLEMGKNIRLTHSIDVMPVFNTRSSFNLSKRIWSISLKSTSLYPSSIFPHQCTHFQYGHILTSHRSNSLQIPLFVPLSFVYPSIILAVCYFIHLLYIISFIFISRFK